jgi:hypothetical protein
MKFQPNMALARRVPSDIGCDDVDEVYRAIERRCAGLLFIDARRYELNRTEYEDVCFAVELELARGRRHRLRLEA